MKTKQNNDKTDKNNQSELKSRPDQQQQHMQTAEAGVLATSEVAAASPLPSAPEIQGKPERPRIDYARRRQNRSLPKDRVLALLRQYVTRAYELAEVVGDWVWITFPERQPSEITAELAQMGFHWNAKRKAWQHPCGVFRSPASDPRKKYESYHPADHVAA